MQLRDYQARLIDDIRTSIRRGNKSIVAVLGCGGGKSIIQGMITRYSNDKGNRVLFLVHQHELCSQIKDTFSLCGVDFGLCDICMVQTVSRHIDRIMPPDLIITDEAHHSTANTYMRIYNAFPDTVRLGFTATPIRLNKGGLGNVYSDLITSVSTKWLIDNHYLAPYRYYSVRLADTSGLHVRAGEYRQNEVNQLMQSKEIYGETVRQWERLASGRKTIVYCSGVEASEQTARQFREAGYSAQSLDGTADKAYRGEIMGQFRRGDITILCNCELFGEGLDVPDCGCVVLLRPTQSLTLYIQQSMRSMRYMPGKEAVIIDHVGNCYIHGLPDDDRTWSLEPKEKQESKVKIRECRQCFTVYPPTEKKCPVCGAEAEHEIRRDGREVIDVDLAEVRRKDDLRNTRLRDAKLKTWEEIVEFRKIKGYKFAWCLRYAAVHDIDIPKKYSYMRRIMGI